jgi:hypothetical protein
MTSSGVIEPDADWITTEDAAKRLEASPQFFQYKPIRESIRHKTRSLLGQGAQGAGFLWCRADVDLVAQIRREARISLAGSAKVADALRRGAIGFKETE